MKRRRLWRKSPPEQVWVVDSDHVAADDDILSAEGGRGIPESPAVAADEEIFLADGSGETHDVPAEPTRTCQRKIEALNTKTLKNVMEGLLRGKDLDKVSFRAFLGEMESTLDLDSGSLQDRKAEIAGLLDRLVRKEIQKQLVESVRRKQKPLHDVPVFTKCSSTQILLVYLVTFSPSNDRDFTRQQVLDAMINALATAQTSRAVGQAAEIEKCVVFKEPNKDRSKSHFHIACKLTQTARFGPWRSALAKDYHMEMNFSSCCKGGRGSFIFKLLIVGLFDLREPCLLWICGRVPLQKFIVRT